MEKWLEIASRNGIDSSELDAKRIQRWLQEEPGNPHAYAILGRVRASEGRHEDACDLWRKAIRSWGKGNPLGVGSLWELIAEAHMLIGQSRKAQREFTHAARAFRRGRQARLETIVKDDSRIREASCLLRTGKFKQAARLIQMVRRGTNHAIFEEEIRTMLRQLSPRTVVPPSRLKGT